MNKKGLSTKPWGTEKQFVLRSVNKPIGLTCWGLSEINFLIKLRALLLITQHSNFELINHDLQSKAF